MTKRKAWRYKCDFCKKSGCNSSAIRRHEASCTFNPNRICRMCPLVPNEQRPLAEMLSEVGDCSAAIHWKPDGDEDGFSVIHQSATSEALERIRKAAGGCPACMMTIIKALTKNEGWFDGFDFKKERDAMFKEDNSWREEIQSQMNAEIKKGIGCP